MESTVKTYDLRLRGLGEPDGTIGATTCLKILRALLRAAERSARLAATGSGAASGPMPGWLAAATDIRIGGLKAGSTVLALEAPRLRDAAPQHFAVRQFWQPSSPAGDQTALDLVGRAVQEALNEESGREAYDAAVLEALVELAKAPGVEGASSELTPTDGEWPVFVLDGARGARIEEMLNALPKPRASILAGRLEAIRHRAGRFELVLEGGKRLSGRLHRELDSEILRPFWGKQCLVQGITRFKPSGDPASIEANGVSAAGPGDEVFGALAVGERPSQPLRNALLPLCRPDDGVARPMDLVGTWPGDESVEELLADLHGQQGE